MAKNVKRVILYLAFLELHNALQTLNQTISENFLPKTMVEIKKNNNQLERRNIIIDWVVGLSPIVCM